MTGWLLKLGGAARHAPTVRPRLRLIALPHAGGWPSAFQPWRRVLPPDVELVVAQLPGRGMRSDEPPLRRVAAIVAGLADAVAELDPLATVVLGHSFGCVLGYELTKVMERDGRAPELLAVSARQPPCFPSRPPFAHRGTDRELLTHLVDIGGMSPLLLSRPDLVSTALGAIRADLEALETYERPPTGTAVPVLCLGASDDPVVVAERLQLWSIETTGAFRRRMFTGGHFYLYDPGVAAGIVADLLDTVGAAPPPLGPAPPTRDPAFAAPRTDTGWE